MSIAIQSSKNVQYRKNCAMPFSSSTSVTVKYRTRSVSDVHCVREMWFESSRGSTRLYVRIEYHGTGGHVLSSSAASTTYEIGKKQPRGLYERHVIFDPKTSRNCRKTRISAGRATDKDAWGFGQKTWSLRA